MVLLMASRLCADSGLSSTPGLTCYGSAHIAMYAIAGVLLVCFVFGLPFALLKTLRSVRSSVRTTDVNFWRRYAPAYVLFDSRQYMWYVAFMGRWAVEVGLLQVMASQSGSEYSYRYTVCGVLIAIEVVWSALRLLMKPLDGNRAVSRLDTFLSCCLITMLILVIDVQVSVYVLVVRCLMQPSA